MGTANEENCVQNGGVWCAASIDGNESSLGSFGHGFQLEDTYKIKYTKKWCNDGALEDYKNNEKNASACRRVCDWDSRCKFYLFGPQPRAGTTRCATFASCDDSATFEDGAPTVYEKLAWACVELHKESMSYKSSVEVVGEQK